MNGIQHQNPLESFQKDTAMSESIRRDANLETTEDQATVLDDMTIENASSRVSLPKEGCEATKNQMNQNQVKSKHREQEKVRKLKINENIDRLLELVPNEQKVKLSKNQILETTYEYICDLQGKCRRYLTMDTGALQEERVNELLGENDRLRKENECFLEIFRTLNIQPNGLLEMNHQLKSVKRDDKFAQNLLSPNQSVNQGMNLMLSPPGQPSDLSLQTGSHLSGPSLLSPTLMNGNLILPQSVEGMVQQTVAMNEGQESMNTELKKESSSHEESHQTDDMDQVFQEIMEATKSSPPLVKPEVDHNQTETSSVCENSKKDSANNSASMSLTSSSQAFVNVSTHQPSVTANEAQPKLTCATTTPATMVTQSLSGPIVTTAGCTVVSTAGQNQMSSQPSANVTSNLKVVVPPTTTAAVGGVQPNVMWQQQGQTLLLSLPGRPGLIPVKITQPSQKSNQPVLLPNQGQCGNLAKQLNPTGQKRRPLKIKEQGKDGAPRPPGPTLTLQPQVMGAPSAPQTMTVRLPVGATQPQGNVVWNGNQMVMQPTVQQPVVINTPGGGQQTVYMQVPVQFQQPVVQQPQQVVYIQQNGQLIPVVVNPPQQQVVSNPVIVNSVQQQQSQQVQEQRPSAVQPVTTSADSQPSMAEPSVSSETSQQQGESLQHMFANQGNVGTSVSSALPSSVVTTSQTNRIPHVNLNDQSAFRGDALSVNQYDTDKEVMPTSQFASPLKPPMTESSHQNFSNGRNMDIGKLGDTHEGNDCMDANDILAQAAEHIFPQSGGDGSHQGDGILGMDSSSNQEEERSHKSSKKKKKKSKSKEKDKDRGKKDKKSRKAKKKSHEEQVPIGLDMAKDNNLPSSSQAILERLLQDTEQAALENVGDGARIGGGDENSDMSTMSGNTNIVSSQGIFMSGYPSQQNLSQATSTTASKASMVNSDATIAQSQSPDGNDILSNSMNFIGLPTLGEENEEQTESKETESKEIAGREDIGTVNGEECDAAGADDDDDDTEAHAFSPPTSPDGVADVSPTEDQQQMEDVNMPTSEGFPKPNSVGQNSYSEGDTSIRLTQGIEKSPPPAYPGSPDKAVRREQGGQVKSDVPESRATSQPLDILSQPWLNPTTVSSQQNFVTSANVQFQKTPMSEALQFPSSQTASPYDNITGYSRESEPQPFSNSHSVTFSQAPMSTINSNPPFRPGVTDSHQMTPPTFNFYSQTSAVASSRALTQILDKSSVSVESSGSTTTASYVPQVSVGLFAATRQTGGTLMRTLEKPPLPNKSFTKANIHRTLTSFDKVEQEKEEKWAKEKGQIKPGKEPPKPQAPAKSAPEKAAEEVDDSVGHRALDRDLVNKFPWLADGEDPKGNKPNMNPSKGSRNPTPFSVQSMAQSSAQSSVNRKRQDKSKRGPTPKEHVTGKPSQQQGDGNSWNLWNPSFSRSNEKPRNDVTDDEITIISDTKETSYKETTQRTQLAQANPKSMATSDPGISSSADHGTKPKRKGQQSLVTIQQNQTKSSPDFGSNKDSINQSSQLNLDNALGGSISQLPMYPVSQSQQIHVSDSLLTPLSQYNSVLFTSDTQTSTTKLFASKNSSQYPFSKSSPMENSGSALQTTQERDHSNSGDIFQNPVNLDFLFEKTDQSDLTDNMVDSLHSDPNSASHLGKQSPLSGIRNSPYEQIAVSNTYSQPNPVNIGRQPSQGGQRLSNSQQARSLSSQPSTQGVKRSGNELQMHSGPPKRQKEVDLFRGSPMSDGNHMGSPDNSSGSYGSPMMPGDHQSSGLGDRSGSYRYQQGIQGYSGQQSPNVSGMQSGYSLGRGDQGSSKKGTSHPSIDTPEAKRTKGMSAQERNTDIEVQSWSGQSMTTITQGSSRGNSRHMERTTQNTSFISELPSPTLPTGFTQNDVTASPANSTLLSSLSPTRHLRPNELPTYLPSIPVRNSILTSPPYPGKTGSSRDTEISFDSMFSSTRSNSLPLNVSHNYSMFSDHPSHNSGLSTVKHGHMTSHVGNSAPFNFSNIFHDAPISTSQGHPNPTSSLNHSLHPAILGNTMQSPVEEPIQSLRGGVNQRHRNQQLGNATMRLDHLLGQNPTVDARGTFSVGPMGVPPHLSNPFVPSMPPF